MEEKNNINQEETIEKFLDELNTRYEEPRKAFDKAYNEYMDLLVDLQTVLAVGFENRALFMTIDNTNSIITITNAISDSELVKIFAKVENSPVTNSIRTALALWDTTVYTISYYINNKMNEADSEDKSGTVLHVIASIVAIFELLQHAISFANFEDTIDKTEYLELYTKFQSLMGADELKAAVDSTEE